MEEESQKFKRLSYTAKFERDIFWCAEVKRNGNAATIFEDDESNVRLRRKHKAAISVCEASRKKITGPKKWRCTETDDAVFTFFHERR